VSIHRDTLPKQHSFQFLTEGDQRDIEMLERVQKQATKILSQHRHLIVLKFISFQHYTIHVGKYVVT